MTGQARTIVQSNGRTAPTAAVVMRRACACGQHTHAEECEQCRRKRATLERKNSGSSLSAVGPPIAEEVLRVPGEPLDRAARAFTEPRFRSGFEHVRVHADARAAESARQLNALAYTVEPHVAFGAGQYMPGSLAGRKLLGHDWTHTLEQRHVANIPGADLQTGERETAEEHEASRNSERVAHGAVVPRPNFRVAPSVQRQTTSSARTPGAATPGQKQAEQAPAVPPIRQLPNYRIGDAGLFNATLEPRGKPPGNAPGFLCSLTATMRVKFNFDNSHGVWPQGLPAKWQQDFVNMVAKRWSTKYVLLPKTTCANEGCTMAVVYVRVEAVTSREHHQLTIYYNLPGLRSHAGLPGQAPAEFKESDVRPHGGVFSREQTTGAHEAGHWLGLEHIFCRSGSDFCYGITNGQSDDVMGRGEYVSGRDYEPFLEVMRHATGCNWKTNPEGGLRGGSLALAFGLFGAGLGALLGVAAGLSAGGIVGLGAALGLLGAFEGFMVGDLR